MTRHRLLLLVVVLGAASCSSGGSVVDAPVKRVLVVSMPGVSWDDVRDGDLPTFAAFAEDAAVGNLATRVGRREATLAGAYLTMGAGTRAVAPEVAAGVALEPGELYHAEPASDVLRRRLGDVPEGVAYLPIGAARDANDSSAYGADIGALGDALAGAGVHRAVVANADVREGRADDDTFGRAAVALLTGSDGLLDGGAVGRSLLMDVPGAPFGVALDIDRAVEEAARSLDAAARAVVLVEASDLQRAIAYDAADTGRREQLRQEALTAADELFGRLLALVDHDDAVLVVAPIAPRGAPDLGLVALRTPEGGAGLLRSATTRRDGYVQLADVAPTILSLVGGSGLEDVEGRAFRIGDGGGRPLVDRLATAGDLAAFRDRIVPITVTVLIVALVALTFLAVVRRWLPPAVTRAVPVAAAGMLGILPATFASAVLGVDQPVAFVLLLVAGGALVAAVSWVAEQRWPGTMPLVSVGVVLTVISVDVLAGARLQLNTVFGYSVAVAGRFAGVGNLAFALLGASALVFAALVAERFGRRGRTAAVVVLLAVLLVDGLPVLGADVGGVLSIVPAFGVAALLLVGRRVGALQALGLAVAAFVSLVVVAFVDLARPDEDQTHLARLAEHMLDRRWRPFFDNVTRRWSANFGNGDVGAWVVLVLLAAAMTAFLVVRLLGPRLLRGRPPLSGPARAAIAGLLVLATLGLVANDSSFAVPFTMLLVVAPAALQRIEADPVERAA